MVSMLVVLQLAACAHSSVRTGKPRQALRLREAQDAAASQLVSSPDRIGPFPSLDRIRCRDNCRVDVVPGVIGTLLSLDRLRCPINFLALFNIVAVIISTLRKVREVGKARLGSKGHDDALEPESLKRF